MTGAGETAARPSVHIGRHEAKTCMDRQGYAAGEGLSGTAEKNIRKY